MLKLKISNLRHWIAHFSIFYMLCIIVDSMLHTAIQVIHFESKLKRYYHFDIVCRSDPSSIDTCPPPLYLFLPTRYCWNVLGNITPMKWQINTKIKPWEKVFSSCLEDYKTILHDFYKQHFYIHQQAKIWFFEIITVSGIKGS